MTGIPLRMAGTNLSGQTNFIQGNIGGGGYSIGLSVALDGSGNTRMLLRNDEPGVWLWKSNLPTAWKNVTTTPGCTFTSLGSFGSPYEVVFGKSQGAGQLPWAYMTADTTVPLLAANGRNQTRMAVWKSTDGGDNWTKTSLITVSGYDSINKFSGPHMAVDPNNSAICYVMALPGVVYVTYNGGTTWHRVNALLAALPSGTSASNITAGNQTFTLVSSIPAGVTTDWACYDATNELALGTNSGFDVIIGTNAGAKTITVPELEPLDGSSSGPSVRSGDTIYFGLAAGVVIDGASGTVTNPGIALGDSGATGVASNIVYFGWCKGASSLWWTQNGNPESAAAMTGGPSALGGGAINGKLHLSNDAVLTGGGCNVLYVTDGDTQGWRFVSTPPTGSGLTANTWTHLPTVQSSSPCCFAPDPFVAGRVAALSYRQLVNNVLTGYGITSVGGNTGVTTAAGQSGADAPWLATCADIFGSDGAFDLVVQNKLWSLSGLGVWYSTIPTTGNFTQLITTASKGMESLIPCKILKAPSPNGRILWAGEDRQLFSFADENTPPQTYYQNSGIGGGVGNGFDITYSDSDPTVCWGSSFNLARSTDSGQTWTQVNALVGQATIASTAPLKAVIVPPNATGNIQYTTDGGANWTTSTYLGTPFVGTGGQAFDNFYHLITDGTGNYFYYDYSTNNPTGAAGLFKSTDDGATWTLVKAISFVSTFYPTGGSATGGGACLKVVPGNPTHLYYAPGQENGAGFNPNRPLIRSTDGGLNWSAVSSVYWGQSISFGKNKPGVSYPATYLAGQLVSQGTFGIFRCDDITQVSPVWVQLSNVTNVTSDATRCGLSADLETYGKIYGGTSGSGYWVGSLG